MATEARPLRIWSERIEDADGDALELTGYDDGDIEVHLEGPSVVLTPGLREELCEALDRAAMPGQPGGAP